MRIPLAIAFSLALTACAGSSPRIVPAQLSELEKGRTTITEVVHKFGRPSVVSKNPDGTQTAMYMHGEGSSDTTTMIPLISPVSADSETLYFDSRGVLTDYKSTRAPAGVAGNAQGGVNTSGLAGSSKNTSLVAGKTARTDDKTPQGQPSGWSFLIPSSTKDNR